MNPRTKRRLVLSGAVAGSLAVVVVGGLVGRNWYRAAQVAERRREGLELFTQRRFEAALPALGFAARDRSDLEVLLALAECRMAVPERENRHMVTARGYLSAVLSQDPSNVRALRSMLECYIALGYVAEIPGICRRILEQDARSVRAHESLLEVAAAAGRWKDAVTAARALQSIEPAALRWRAVELQCLSADGADPAGRLSLIRGWRRDDPDNAGLALLEADTLRQLGQLPAARELLESLAARGMPDRKSLEALLDSLDALGLGAKAEQAIEASVRLEGGQDAIAALECERLLRAGRIERLTERLAEVKTANAEFARLRFAAAYLSGRLDEARASVTSTAGPDGVSAAPAGVAEDDAFAVAARFALGNEPIRRRIEGFRTLAQRLEGDPLVTLLLADLYLDGGETDQGHALLVRGFERADRRWLPLGIRALRLSVALGRVPEALSIARDLAQRYPQDASVALAVAEAWAAAMRAGYALSLVEGSLGSESPEALARFWIDIGRPPNIAPLVAEALLARGATALAADVSASVADDADEALLLSMFTLLDRLPEGERDRLLAACNARAASPRMALALATRLEAAGDRDGATRLLSGAVSDDPAEARRLELRRSALAGADGASATAALRDELARTRDLATASFVLAQGAAWSEAALISDAILVLKESVGEDSIRAIIAEGTAAAVFAAGDQPRIAAAIAALADASQRAPESVSVLATLARLLESADPPDPIKARELLERAVQIEPGAVEVYPDLVRLAQETGEFAAAEQAIEAYIRLVGQDLASQRRAADLRERQGQLDEAAQLHRQLAGRTQATIDRLALARIRQRLGFADEARAILRELLESDSGLVVERDLALLEAREGRLPDARAVLAAARERVAGDPKRLAQLELVRADIELGFGDPALAAEIARALPRDETGGADLLLARVLVAQGDMPGARAALTRAIEASPANPAILPIAATVMVGDPGGRDALRRALEAARGSRPELVEVVEILDLATDATGRIAPSAAVLERARDLTVRYSGSPLVWRFAIEMLLSAGQADDAARLSMTALSRLPNDTSIAESATRATTLAGALEDALAAAAAWRRIGGADLADVESARATIELIRRAPSRGFEVMRPLAAQIQLRSSADAPLRMLVVTGVTAGREREVLGAVEALAPDRRATAAAAWIEAARSVEPTRRAELLATLAAHRASESWFPADAMPLLIAAWNEACLDGAQSACAAVEPALAKAALPSELKALLAADLAAARGDAAADGAYRAIYEPALAAVSLDVAGAASRFAAASASPEALQIPALAVAAMNNHAEFLQRTGGDAARAVTLAQIAEALAVGSPEAADCLARALAKAGRLDEAMLVARRCDDPLLGSIAQGEILAAAGDVAGARAAERRAQTVATRTMLPVWSIAQRLRALERALEAQP